MTLRKKAVVLLSGGLDSTTALAVALAEGFEVYAISFQYGQRHAIELTSARRIAKAYAVEKHLVIDVDLRVIGGSALTDEIDVQPFRLPTYRPATRFSCRSRWDGRNGFQYRTSSLESTRWTTQAIPTVGLNTSKPSSDWRISPPGQASKRNYR